ncbi:proprotein convertase subtilisin/kexin type 1 inhibitor, like [Lepisosteus oculatus]|uniref:proprotein convertase subtilisin/kexin type 1 inhibitor, like n=1 Tax=Lepisosteus oculatus TaxID=7918 RepID=UPI0035F51B02
MSGPLSSTAFLLLSSTLLLTSLPPLPAKPLSSGGPRSGWGTEEVGGAGRMRRDLRDSLPYEAQMVMSYPPPGAGLGSEGRNNEIFYQPGTGLEGWKGRGVGEALQQLVDDDRRRDQEAIYLAGLLRLLSESYGAPQKLGLEETGDFQGPYPPDYDETEQGLSMDKPQAAWQGLLDPQLTQALLNRYRQERLRQASLPPTSRLLTADSRSGGPGGEEGEEEVLRYLVGRVLSSLASETPQQTPSRLAKRDLAAAGDRPTPPLKRPRRSLDDGAPPSPRVEPSLLRVKRLGDEEEEEEEERAAAAGGARAGLQRMKRIDSELQGGGRPARKRRAVTYDPDLLAQRILQYLPE